MASVYSKAMLSINLREAALLHKYKTVSFTRNSFLVVCWILGLLFGFLLGFRPAIHLLQPIRLTLAFQTNLIVSILFSVFPIIITYIFIRYLPSFVFYIVFFRAFIFGSLLGFVVFAYGSAAWLARWLFLFASSSCTALYIMFILKEDTSFYRLLRYIIASVLIVIISHFLTRSINSGIKIS